MSCGEERSVSLGCSCVCVDRSGDGCCLSGHDEGRVEKLLEIMCNIELHRLNYIDGI